MPKILARAAAGAFACMRGGWEERQWTGTIRKRICIKCLLRPKGVSKMAAGDQHRKKAAEFHSRAQSERRPQIQAQFETLARAHLHLAAVADVNERVKVIDDLCRELGSWSAKSKRGFHEPPRSKLVIQTERDSSAKGIALAVGLFALTFIAVFVFW